jgi:hypothetical protein
MVSTLWPTKRLLVAKLHLDAKNPRLGQDVRGHAPRDIIQHLFDHDKALEIAQSIVFRGYFVNEPLLAIVEDGQHIVVEGNRRLAALKALREPALIEGNNRGKIERLSRKIADINSIVRVPVTIAPDRKSTDKQIAGRHLGTPVLAWRPENRASFILEKLEEGYSNDDLRDELGFTLADIQDARLTRAITDMARSIDLTDEVKAKVESPKAQLFTTIKRVFDSSEGRKNLFVQPDPDYGIVGSTTKKEFLKGFSKLVTDLALGKESSRTLNTNEDINNYFKKWSSEEKPKKKRGRFVPSDVIKEKKIEYYPKEEKVNKKKSKSEFSTVIPSSLKVRYGTDRLVDIRRELIKIKRKDYPNAGAVLLRVFFELSVHDYLKRTGDLDRVVDELRKKNKLRHGVPTLRDLFPTLKRIAKNKLSNSEAAKVEKAIRYDPAAPFTLNDLHSFVHNPSDIPGERDIYQFWIRTEPLFRLMLESDPES